MKRKGLLLLLIFMCIYLIGCARPKVSDVFRFEVRELQLTVGEEKELDLIRGDVADNEIIVYTMYISSKDGYIEAFENKYVSCTGSVSTIYDNDSTQGVNDIIKVLGKQKGTIRFTAYLKSSPNVTDSIVINVTDKILSSMQLVCEKDRMYVNEEQTLSVVTNPGDIPNDVIYTIDKGDIASINQNGVIKGLKEGTVVVTATSKYDPSLSVKKIINVVYANATDVILNKQEVELINGDTFQIEATVEPSYALNSVTYTTSDKNVATVDANGLVKAVGANVLVEGKDKATITVKSSDGKATSELIVTVIYPDAETLTIENEEDLVKLHLMKTFEIKANVTPVNANQDIIVEILEGESITVNKNKLTAVALGKTKIRVSTIAKDSSKVLSKEYDINVDYDTLLAISVSNKEEGIKPSETLQLKVNLTPVGSNPSLISYSSSDETILMINETGLVTAIKPGTATITVKGTEGIECEYTLVVYDAVTSIKLDSDNLENDVINLIAGDICEIYVTVEPTTALKSDFTCQLSTEDFASFTLDDTTIVLETYDPGEFTLTVKSGSVEKTITVKITLE